MSLRFKCPSCQTVRNLHPRMMGREVKCPECDAPVQIPSQEEIDAAKQEREAEKRFLEAAKQIAATGIYSSPTSSQFQALTARPTKPVAKPQAASEVDEDEEEPMMERRSLPHDHIDMTPMVDITFLLLIFFMSTANFTLQKSLEVPVQKQQKASTRAVQVANDETHDSITVQIDEFNSYLVLMPDGTDREAASKPDLMTALRDASTTAPGVEPPDKLIVDAHRDCMHKAVVVALDSAGDIKTEDGRSQFQRFQVNVVEEFN